MGLFNKYQIGCKCCCFARPPVDPQKIAFIATGDSIFPNDDDRIWPYLGRAEDVFSDLYAINGFEDYATVSERPGWLWGSSGTSGLGYGMVILDPPVAEWPFAGYSPALPEDATIIAHFGTPRNSVSLGAIYEWVVDSHCNRYRLPSLNNPNLRLFRQVTRQPNAPE